MPFGLLFLIFNDFCYNKQELPLKEGVPSASVLFCFPNTEDRKHQSTAVIGKMKQTTTTNENAIWLRTLLTQKGETLKDQMAGRI